MYITAALHLWAIGLHLARFETSRTRMGWWWCSVSVQALLSTLQFVPNNMLGNWRMGVLFKSVACIICHLSILFKIFRKVCLLVSICSFCLFIWIVLLAALNGLCARKQENESILWTFHGWWSTRITFIYSMCAIFHFSQWPRNSKAFQSLSIVPLKVFTWRKKTC